MFKRLVENHHKIVLAFLAILMAASFVLYGFVGPSSGPSLKRTLYRGVNLADSRETRDARDIAAFGSIFEGAPKTPAQFDAAVKNAVAGGEKASADSDYSAVLGMIDSIRSADEAGVPQPDAAAIRSWIENAFRGDDGKFSQKQFRSAADHAREIGIDDVRLQQVIAQLWRIQKASAVITPLAAPASDVLAGRLVARHAAKWTVETAVFAASSFKLPTAPTDKELTDYLTKNKETYRIAPKLRVAVIKVEGKPAAVSGTPSEAELIETLRRHAAEFPETRTLTQATAPAFLKANTAKLAAMAASDKAGEKAAVKLTRKLDEILPRTTARPDAAKLAAILKSADLAATALPPFSAQELPKNTGIPDAQFAGALQLSETNWRTYVSSDGATAYAFVYDSTVPARDPAFAEVREKVLADYTAEETRRRFLETGRAKAVEIAAAVKAGKTFADAAKAAGFVASPVATFDYAKPPEGFDAYTLNVLENVPVGGVSGALDAGADLKVAHLVARVEPPVAKDAAGLAAERDRLGALAARATFAGIRAADGR